MNVQTLVRVPCSSRAEAKDLALRLTADEYRVGRRWKLVTAAAETEEDAARLIRALHLRATAGGLDTQKKLAETRLRPAAGLSLASLPSDGRST